jgi:hypothetical protein
MHRRQVVAPLQHFARAASSSVSGYMATLTALLGELQTPDNDVRKAAEERLESALGADPDQLLTELVRVAKEGESKDVSSSE